MLTVISNICDCDKICLFSIIKKLLVVCYQIKQFLGYCIRLMCFHVISFSFVNCDKIFLFSVLLMTEMMMILSSSENVFEYWPIKLVSYLGIVKNCMISTPEWMQLTNSSAKNWRRKESRSKLITISINLRSR
jgi:hypothetical protein